MSMYLPEVGDGVWKRTLGCNEHRSLWVMVNLKNKTMFINRKAFERLEDHSYLIVDFYYAGDNEFENALGQA